MIGPLMKPDRAACLAGSGRRIMFSRATTLDHQSRDLIHFRLGHLFCTAAFRRLRTVARSHAPISNSDPDEIAQLGNAIISTCSSDVRETSASEKIHLASTSTVLEFSSRPYIRYNCLSRFSKKISFYHKLRCRHGI